jgi:ABC-type bacteriocin/lantibiotic exporter with double-glycine peptidase domain
LPGRPIVDHGAVELRGPGRFLWWLARQQPGRVAVGAVYGSVWMASMTLTPYLVSQAVDRGLEPRRAGPLAVWAAAVLGIGILNAISGIMRHRTMTRLRLEGALGLADAILVHATRLGAALPRRITSGEVVTIGLTDCRVAAETLTASGPGVGAVVAYALVAVLMFGISPLLAVVVLAGVPVLAVVVGPLLRRLQAAGGRYREQQGALAGRLVDVLGGLQILNGLGGKAGHAERFRRESAALRAEGYRVGAVASWIQALGAGLPAIFLAVVTLLAARLTQRGDITIGQLIAVYGYAAVLVVPVSNLIELGNDVGHGIVAGRRIIGFMRLPVDDPAGIAAPERPATLHDPASGVSAAPGELTVLAGAGAAGVIDRLGRYGDTDATWGGIRLDRIATPEIRERVLVADPDADLFAGTLAAVIAGRDEPGAEALRAAVEAAVAVDVGDLDHPVDWDGRNLSGGQRQRVRLARALLAGREMLLAAEPTSAVDAHTEAAIAERLSTGRAGRGTVLATTSPVLLDRADVVHYLVDGRVAASGTHRSLMATSPGYRALVTR